MSEKLFGFNIVEDKAVPKGEAYFIPTHLNLVLVGNELKVLEGKQLRDLTDDEKRYFLRITNIAALQANPLVKEIHIVSEDCLRILRGLSNGQHIEIEYAREVLARFEKVVNPKCMAIECEEIATEKTLIGLQFCREHFGRFYSTDEFDFSRQE